MIRYENQRYESNGELCGDLIWHNKSIDDAIIALIRYELGYGGQITSWEKTKIVVETHILSRYDIVTFSGSEDDMSWLHAAAELFIQTRRSISTDEIVDRVMQISNGKPLIITTAAGMIEGAMVMQKIRQLLTTTQGAQLVP